jgi:hypothetical protein
LLLQLLLQLLLLDGPSKKCTCNLLDSLLPYVPTFDP